MTTRTSPHNQTTVPVLDRNGQPLAPARPSRVRRWLESGRATKVWIKHIFAVQLHDLDTKNCNVGNFTLNLDPGETTGIAITRETPNGKRRYVVGAYEHQHRNQEIHHNLDQRRDCRRNRRGRIRRRPARFDNRKKHDGWLPPSLQSIVDDFPAIAETMLRLYPISAIRLEYLRFDTQMMQNPDIKGVEYQQGTLQGWQLKHYIFHRDRWSCQYCGKSASKTPTLTLDHIIPQSQGGPSRVNNLVAACRQCNTRKSDRSLADFLAHDPDQVTKIQQQVNQLAPLTAAGHLNSVMPKVLEALEKTGLPVTICDGVSTSYTRKMLTIPKSHVNDAACLGLPATVVNHTPKVTTLKRQGRHRRQSINCDASGSPAIKDFPAYSRLPREQQGYTTPPSHSTGPRRLRGIASGDIVRIRHHSGRSYTGRATLYIKDQRVVIKGKPTVSAKTAHAVLIAHRQRWAVATQNQRNSNTSPVKPATE